jgi:chromosome segregation ATPase
MRASAAEPQANTTSQGQAAKLATERKAGGNPQDSGHPVSDLEQAKKRIAELERSNARLQQSLSAAIRELHGQRSNMLRSKLYILDSSARKTAMDRAMKSMKSDQERAVLEQQRAIRQLKAAQDEMQKDAANQQQLKSRMQESIDARKTAQAQLQAAQSQLADKVSQYKRLEELQRQGYVTNFDVRAAQTSLKDAQAQVALSEAYQQQVSRRLEESLKKQFEQQQMHQTLLKLEFRIEELEEHLKKLENLNRAKLTIPPDAPAANLARPYQYPVELTYQLASGG